MLLYTEELRVYQGMKTLLKDEMPKKEAVGYEHAQRGGPVRVVGEPEEAQKTWDEHAGEIKSKQLIDLNSKDKEPIVIQAK